MGGCVIVCILDVVKLGVLVVYVGIWLDWYSLYGGCCLMECFGVEVLVYLGFDLLGSVLLDILLLLFLLVIVIGFNFGVSGGMQGEICFRFIFLVCVVCWI